MNTIAICKRCHNPCREHIAYKEMYLVCVPTWFEKCVSFALTFFPLIGSPVHFLYQPMTNLEYLEYMNESKK